MIIEEFISQYADIEMQKVQFLLDRGAFNIEDYVNFNEIELSPSSKNYH